MYITSIRRNENLTKKGRNWLRNILILCTVYIVSYAIYAVLINQFIIRGFLFYLQIISMSLLVLFTTVINYPIICSPDLTDTYLVASTVTGSCKAAPITDYEYVVTVTDNGGGSYSLSGFSGGMYDGLFCGPFDICGYICLGKTLIRYVIIN
ncbi:hypothetical protein ACWGOQ_0011270 [Aquimarina sp. M1]